MTVGTMAGALLVERSPERQELDSPAAPGPGPPPARELLRAREQGQGQPHQAQVSQPEPELPEPVAQQGQVRQERPQGPAQERAPEHRRRAPAAPGRAAPGWR